MSHLPWHEDWFDGDPVKYPLFVSQFQDNVLNYYEHSDPAHALVKLALASRERARKIVEACQADLNPDRPLKTALEDLKEVFGTPQLHVDAQLTVLKEGPVIKPTADGLQDLYVDLLRCGNLLISAGVEEEFDAPSTTEVNFKRLPMTLQRRFIRLAVHKGFQAKRIPYREVMSEKKFVQVFFTIARKTCLESILPRKI